MSRSRDSTLWQSHSGICRPPVDRERSLSSGFVNVAPDAVMPTNRAYRHCIAVPCGVVRSIRVVFSLLLLFQLCALALQAQSVRGVVLEADSGAPIAGAMVILLVADESVAVRVLTDDVGRFLAEVTHPGEYRARVDRIGYESLTTDTFDVPADGVFRRILVPIQAIDLAGLDVSASRRCRLRQEVGEATVALWEEARKALEAAAWTLESGRYSYTLLGFVRRLDREGGDILEENREFVSGRGQSPYVSRPAQELADSGYVRELADGNLNYFAPDAEVLLSEAFLNTHCLRVQPGKDSRLGLAFEPIGGRSLPEIRGVLWINAATAMLTHLEFRYVNLPWGRAVGDAGGEVTFERLPAGTWIVRDWHVRMPLLQLGAVREFDSAGRLRYDRIGYQEKGGIVWRVVDPSGAAVREAAAATISGQATDSLGKTPLPGAVATARGLGVRAVSDSTGAFVLSGLPPGRIVLDVAHPSLDSLSLVALGAAAVNIDPGGTAQVEVRVPGVYEVLSRACAEVAEARGVTRPSGTTILLGRVRDRGRAAAGAIVRLEWLSASEELRSVGLQAVPPRGPGGSVEAPVWRLIEPQARDWLETTLDDRGTLLLCDIASPSQLRVAAASGERSGEVTVSLARGQMLKIASVHLTQRQTQRQGVLHGRVQDATTGKPISSAIVSILGDDSLALVTTSTDTRGLSSLPVLEAGTFRVRAEQLGYRTTVSDSVRLGPSDTVEIELRLAPTPLLLDSILVSVRRAGRSLRAGEQLVFGRLLDDDTRFPIPAGTVRLLTERGSVAASATTTDQGQYWLISPQAGTYRLQAEHIGYETGQSPAVNLMLGDSIGIDFYLSTEAVLLAPIMVTASRRAWSDRASLIGMEGFLSRYERFARSGFGTFMIRDSIAWWETRTRTVGDMLLAKAPQVRSVVPFGDPIARELGGAVIMRGGRASGGVIESVCIPSYYLDGAPVPYTVVSAFGPADLEAVELYVSPQIPAEFLTGFPCGVIAYWSRRTPEERTGRRTVWSVLLGAALVTGTIFSCADPLTHA